MLNVQNIYDISEIYFSSLIILCSFPEKPDALTKLFSSNFLRIDLTILPFNLRDSPDFIFIFSLKNSLQLNVKELI